VAGVAGVAGVEGTGICIDSAVAGESVGRLAACALPGGSQ